MSSCMTHSDSLCFSLIHHRFQLADHTPVFSWYVFRCTTPTLLTSPLGKIHTNLSSCPATPFLHTLHTSLTPSSLATILPHEIIEST